MPNCVPVHGIRGLVMVMMVMVMMVAVVEMELLLVLEAVVKSIGCGAVYCCVALD